MKLQLFKVPRQGGKPRSAICGTASQAARQAGVMLGFRPTPLGEEGTPRLYERGARQPVRRPGCCPVADGVERSGPRVPKPRNPLPAHAPAEYGSPCTSEALLEFFKRANVLAPSSHPLGEEDLLPDILSFFLFSKLKNVSKYKKNDGPESHRPQ